MYIMNNTLGRLQCNAWQSKALMDGTLTDTLRKYVIFWRRKE